MQDYLIIADIAGQYDALLRLVARVPETTKIIAVGDLVDRGPKSKEVVAWFMKNPGRADSLMGNHEHMMVDYFEGLIIYERGVWFSNGGVATMKSYDPIEKRNVPRNHLDWLATRPMFKLIPAEDETPALLVSHAALDPDMTIEEAAQFYHFGDTRFHWNFLWNRGLPEKQEFFQVMGHNSHWGLKHFEDWGICIDQSSKSILTGMLWPSREILEEPYELLPKAK